jgi:hypothetical protein
MFQYGGMTISWMSYKQSLIDTSINHSEIIALYEATHECAWLRRVINHIQVSCVLSPLGQQPLSMKIMWLALPRCSQVIWKVMLLNILHINFSNHMNFKLIERLVSCKPSHVIIWLICSLSPYHIAPFLNVLPVLVCIDLEIYRI